MLATIGALATLLLIGASAQQQPLPIVTTDVSIQGYGDTDKTCLEWTDGCRTCGAASTCPNIGIACQPKPILCTKR